MKTHKCCIPKRIYYIYIYWYTAYKKQYYSPITNLFNFSSAYFLDGLSKKGATFWFQLRFNYVASIKGEYFMIFYFIIKHLGKNDGWN